MRKTTLPILAAVAAFLLAGCAPPPAVNNANSGNANANANAKPAAAPPTKEALSALDKKAWEAFKNKDGKFFEDFLADNYVGLDEKGARTKKAETVKMLSEHKCELKSFTFSDEQLTMAGPDAAILTYKAAQDGSCDGKKMPANIWVASVFVRSGDAWKGAYHNEAPATEPKPAAPPKKAADAAAKPPPPPAAAEEKPDPSEDAMVATVRKGWNAWKSQDAKALGDSITKDFVLVDPSGQRFDHAGAIKVWTESQCEVQSFTLDDAVSSSLAKDAGIVTLKGSAEGTCGGMKLGSLWGTYILVKDGETWKAAMIFETPVM